MITSDIANSNPFVQTGLATASVQRLFKPVTIAETIGFSGNCSPYSELYRYENMVLAENAYTSDLKNDKSSFIFQIPPKGTNSLALELFKDGVKIDDLDDNDFGTFYDFGDFTNNAFYTAYVIEWKLVLSTHGVGCYHVRATGTILGSSYTLDSECYELMVYDDHVANGTVAIRWQQDGNILSSAFDFTGMEWEKYIRIPAFFGENEPSEEIDEIQMTSRKYEQIQTEVINERKLITKLIPQWVSSLLINDLALADRVWITDYNAYNHEQDIVDKEVRFSGYEQFNYYPKNRLAKFGFKFKDRKENSLKRLYF